MIKLVSVILKWNNNIVKEFEQKFANYTNY